MDRPRLQVPTANRAILAEPPLGQVDGLVAENRHRLENWDHDFHGRSFARLRAMTRAAAIRAAADSSEDSALRSIAERSTLDAPPLIVTGHQPELFHPGVWVKNFAAASLARQRGGVALHLVVDNDTVKRTTLRIATGTPAEPSVVHLPLDRWQGEIPFEEYRVSDEALFASFGERVAGAVSELGIQPLAQRFWPLAVDAARRTPLLSERLADARRRWEMRWGCRSLELPVSRLCQTEGFCWFACDLLAQLGRFHDEYNQALHEYRRRNRIRSHNHPVPLLGRDDEWLEAPFWVWSEHAPRRRQLFARQRGSEMVLTDRHHWTAVLPLSPDREACCAVEALGKLAGSGIKIRTRALTTTIFIRLCLADLFIHGLGGARYDELSDTIIERIFGLRPPRFLTMTGTLHLPVPTQDATPDEERRIRQQLRDLTYNPDRHLGPAHGSNTDLTRHVQCKWEAIRTEPASRSERRDRFDRIRQLNQALASWTATARDDAARELGRVRAALRANAILQNREWPFCVYPEESLYGFFETFINDQTDSTTAGTEAGPAGPRTGNRGGPRRDL